MMYSQKYTAISSAGLLLLLLALASLPLLCSCGQPDEQSFESGSFLLTPENMQGFTVVRSDGASDLVVREALRICHAISNATGEKVELVTDWQREGAMAQNNTTGGDLSSETQPLELLVGLTSREESQALLPELQEGDHYLLRTEGRKILIAATSETLLADAVDKFLTEYLSIRGNQVHIARQIDYRSEEYPFFGIIRGGESLSGFVLPQNAGSTLVSSVNYIAKRMEEDYGCSFPVLNERNVQDLHGMILVGKSDSSLGEIAPPLEEGEDGMVKYLQDRLFLIGKTEEATIAAVSEFYAALRSDIDTDCSGKPYAHFDMEKTISCDWKHLDIPYLLGGQKLEEESIATAETRVAFAGVSESLFQHYTDILKNDGFSISWVAVGENKSFYAENALYRLQVTRTSLSSTASLYILRKS